MDVDLRNQLAAQGEITFTVRVRPGAAITQVRNRLQDGTWKIDVGAAPEDGRANAELKRFLAKEFGVQKDSVDLLGGVHSKQKIVRVRTDYS